MEPVDAALKSVASEFLKNLIIREAVKRVAWLAAPFIGPVFGMLVGWLVGLAADEFVKWVRDMVIEATTKAEANAMNHAAIELKKAQETGVDLEKANQEFDSALSDLIHVGKRVRG